MDMHTYKIIALIARYWMFLLGIYMLFCIAAAPSVNDLKKMHRSVLKSGVLLSLAFFTLSGFALLAVFKSDAFNPSIFFMGIDVIGIILLQQIIMRLLFKKGDSYILIIVNFLSAIGLLMLQRLSPSLAMKQLGWFALANLMLFLAGGFAYWIQIKKSAAIFLAILSIALLLMPLVIGEAISGAYNWISFNQFSFQPSEMVKVLMVLILSYALSAHTQFFKLIPMFIFVSILLMLAVIQRDLGVALIYFFIFLCLYYIATSNIMVVVASILIGGGGAAISYMLFDRIKERVAAWQNPFGGTVEYNEGYQIVQSLIAIASGGLFGSGMGLGMPMSIPEVETDFIFSAVCEELGIVYGFIIIFLFMLLLHRGFSMAFKLERVQPKLQIIGSTLSLVLQAFIIIGGVVKFIPLTGVTLPFVSYGGSSLLVSYAFVGLIQGTWSVEADYIEEEENDQEQE